jgi:hypothetical protein
MGWDKETRRRKFKELRAELGGKCHNCQGTHCPGHSCNHWHGQSCLEFAHVRPTGLNGRSRGSTSRYYDVRRNKDCYRLMCHHCHRLFDDGWLQFIEDENRFVERIVEDAGF